MVKLTFLPITDHTVLMGTHLLYDIVWGTGGMLIVAKETLRELADEYGETVATRLYGQHRLDGWHLPSFRRVWGRGRYIGSSSGRRRAKPCRRSNWQRLPGVEGTDAQPH